MDNFNNTNFIKEKKMKRDAQEIVTNAKLLLKDEMSNISFITWINPLELEYWTD